MEVSPAVYAYLEDDTYSPDFVMDTLNLAYLGCTRVYLANAGHLVTFYGKKTKPGAGLSLEQGMAACCLVTEIPTWMGSLAKYTVHTISITEAQELIQGLKHLERRTSAKSTSNLVIGSPLCVWDRLIVVCLPLLNLLCLWLLPLFPNRGATSQWHHSSFKESY